MFGNQVVAQQVEHRREHEQHEEADLGIQAQPLAPTPG